MEGTEEKGRKMRVLFVSTAFARHEGDIITPWLTLTARKLREKGVEVEVFTSSYRGQKSNTVYNIPVHRFRYFPARWERLTYEEAVPERLKHKPIYWLILPFYLACGCLNMFFLLLNRHYNVIHIYWPLPHIIFGAVGKVFFRIPIVSSFFGVELRWVKTKLPILIPFIKWAIKISDITTAISTYTARETTELQPADIKIIPFGAAYSPEGKSIKRKKTSPPIVLFVGRLVERKGVVYLLRAIKLLKDIPLKLIIVGDGPERKNIEEEVKKLNLETKVEIAGKVDDDTLMELYEKASVFVLPACVDKRGDTEGLGVVLIEALTYEVPVIASKVGGILDIVKDGETGLLVPEKDPSALAKAIKQLLTDTKLAKELAKQGRAFVEKQFSWERVTKDIIKLYKTLSN